MNRDTWTGIVGALVLVAAMTGVFFYERGQFSEYTIVWAPGDPVSTSVDGSALSHGADRSHDFTVNEIGGLLAGVEVVLEWTMHIDDRFEVDVIAPDGTVHRDDGTGGTLTLSVAIQDAPEDATIADGNNDSALDQAWSTVEEASWEAGQGTWNVRVTLVNAMRANEIPVLDDEGGENSYSVLFTRLIWEPMTSTPE